MHLQKAEGLEDKAEVKSTAVAGELELCSELHEGDPGWTTIPEETQDTEQEGEYTYQYESDAVEYPILLLSLIHISEPTRLLSMA